MSHPNEGQDHVDYRETSDITEIHASVLREHEEPKVDTMPIPTWLGLICTISLCWAGAYVGMFHGGFSSSVYNEYDSKPSAFFPLPGGGDNGPAVPLTPLEIGARMYANCVPCHQASGLGNAQFPPLGGSEWVDGSEFGQKRLIALLLKGLNGPVSVKGQTFNGDMPDWQSKKDMEIAGVATFIRQSFGNKATEEITEDMVKSVRKEIKARTTKWTEAELKAIPVDAKIEGAAAPAPAGDKPAAGAAKPAGAAPGTPAPTAHTDPAKPAAAPAAAPGAATFDLAASKTAGKAMYMQTCLVCHQLTGMGLPGAFPPLAKTDYVSGDSRRLVAIVLKGISGALKVNGMTYVTGMPQPDLTFPQLKDDKNVADVLNYVRNDFGNKNDEPITPEFVAKVRKEFADRTTSWTEAELLNFPPAK